MKRYIVCLLLLFSICFWGSGCGQRVEDDSGAEDSPGVDEKIGVAVSILPQAYFVERIGKDKVQVSVMIPPGASPATYEPTPGQLKDLSRARLYIRMGHVPFEKAWMERLLSANGNMKVVDSSRGIEIVGQDPHIWLSPDLVKLQAEEIYAGLVEVDPGNKEYYARNKDAFIQELVELDREINDILQPVENRKFMVFHPAWGYFARDYGLEQIPIEIEGKEPGAGDIAKLVKKARADGIKVVFASPQFSSKAAEVIAGEIDGEVVFVDPLARDYMTNMREVARALARGMEQPQLYKE